MSTWRTLSHGLRSLLRREQVHLEATEEIEHFFELTVADYESQGLSPQEAKRQARIDLGGQVQAKDSVTSYGWENFAGALIKDLHYAGRRLVKEPGSSAIILLTVALGIGATTSIFSVVSSILLTPLPYPEASRILTIWDASPDGSRQEQAFGTFVELQARNHSFAQLTVMKPWQPTLSGGQAPGAQPPERLLGQAVSSTYFEVLGIPVALGRSFHPQDDRAGGPAEAILSHDLWRRHFNSDPDIVSRPIMLDARAYQVIGVMPESFENIPFPEAELWTLLQYDLSQGRAWGHHLRTLARLKPGVSLTAGAHELENLAETPIPEFPRPAWAAMEHGFLVNTLQADVTSGIQPSLLVLFVAAGLVLTIAVVNVMHLLLARSARRRGELALRATLGAGHGRLIRQLLTESMVLATLGGIGGLAIAHLGTRLLIALSPPSLPRPHAIAVDQPTLLLGLGLTFLIGTFLSLGPAVQAVRQTSHSSLSHSSRRVSTSRGRARSALVVAEVAFSFVLLIGAGLLQRSLEQLTTVESGFEPSQVVTLQLRASSESYSQEAAEQFFTRVLERVQETPGVESAAFTSQLPLGGQADFYGAFFETRQGLEDSEELGALRYTASPSYLDTLRIPLIAGRALSEADRSGAPRVALISQSMARKRLPGLDPLGQRLRIGPPDTPPYTVVGVVADVRQESLALGEAEAFYITPEQWHFADRTRRLLVRIRDGHSDAPNPIALGPVLRQAIWEIDSQQPISHLLTMDELVTRSVAKQRFAWILFAAFALVSLILAAAGIYGVLAGGVAERTREVGVRAALGADRRRILMTVIKQGLALTAVGSACGVLIAVVASQALSALIFGVSRFDPLTYLTVAALLGLVAVLACGAPAWRAASIDPATVLRAG